MNGACALLAGYQRLQTNTQSTQNVLLFHCRNGDTKAPQRYVLSTFPVLFNFAFSNVLCLLVSHPPPYKYYFNGGGRKMKNKKKKEEEEEEV